MGCHDSLLHWPRLCWYPCMSAFGWQIGWIPVSLRWPQPLFVIKRGHLMSVTIQEASPAFYMMVAKLQEKKRAKPPKVQAWPHFCCILLPKISHKASPEPRGGEKAFTSPATVYKVLGPFCNLARSCNHRIGKGWRLWTLILGRNISHSFIYPFYE